MKTVEKSPGWKIDYLGWSGFHISRLGGPDFYIDPPKATHFPATPALIIFITHGHPEHIGGAMDLMADSEREQSITIIASKVVCRYLARQCRGRAVTFSPVEPGQKIPLAVEINLEVFQWQHMPLLPPGFGPAVRHMVSIIRKFRTAWQIIKMSLKGPPGPGEMLGYLLSLPGSTIIIYGEGLHRHCRLDEVVACEGATLLVASEPEDSSELPRLVAASGATKAILYEPHRQWRDLFSLPHIDMEELQKQMEKTGISVEIAEVKS